ncbi:MAG: hypothetical protein ABJA86_08390 [Nocardioidaceae bacterium]
MTDLQPTPPVHERWGVRTLIFLGLMLVSISAGNILQTRGIKEFHAVAFIGTWLGLLGAAVCSLRGVLDAVAWLRRRHR